jgi:hypothetical protein
LRPPPGRPLLQAQFDNIILDLVTLVTVCVFGIRVLLGYKRMADRCGRWLSARLTVEGRPYAERAGTLCSGGRGGEGCLPAACSAKPGAAPVAPTAGTRGCRFKSFVNELLREKTVAGQEAAVDYLATSAALQQFKQVRACLPAAASSAPATRATRHNQAHGGGGGPAAPLALCAARGGALRVTGLAGGLRRLLAPESRWDDRPLGPAPPFPQTSLSLSVLAAAGRPLTEVQLTAAVEQLLGRHGGASVVFDAAESLRELRRLGLLVEQQPAELAQQQLHARTAAAAAAGSRVGGRPDGAAAGGGSAAAAPVAGLPAGMVALMEAEAAVRRGPSPWEDPNSWAKMLGGVAVRQEDDGDAAAPRYHVVDWREGVQVRVRGGVGAGAGAGGAWQACTQPAKALRP